MFRRTCTYGLRMDTRRLQDALFTWGTRPGMGLVGTHPCNPPSKLGHAHDKQGTTPECSCVNGTVPARVMEGNSRTVFVFLAAFSLRVKKCRYFFVLPHLRDIFLHALDQKSQSDITNANHFYSVNDGHYHCLK